jgi:hypothetical protein
LDLAPELTRAAASEDQRSVVTLKGKSSAEFWGAQRANIVFDKPRTFYVRFVSGAAVRIIINSTEYGNASLAQAEAHPACAAEEIDRSNSFHRAAASPESFSFRLCFSIPRLRFEGVVPSAFAMRTMLRRLGLRTPLSIPLM